MKDSSLIPVERIEKAIYLIRGEKVMLDSDLASLYGVETKAVNRAAKRNLKRFPSDFMFQLTAKESAALRYQIGTSKEGRRIVFEPLLLNLALNIISLTVLRLS